MTTRQKTLMLTALVLAFTVGGIAGAAFGGYGGYRAGKALILNEVLRRDAWDIRTRVAILRQLRTGQRDKAIEAIETGLDDVLIMLDPDTPFEDLKAETRGDLKNAIDQAKTYRTEYPRSKPNDVRAPAVRSIFERDLYK